MQPRTNRSIHEFRHAVVREAAYQMQLPSVRAESHAAAFGYMHAILTESERNAAAEEMLSHIQAAGDGALSAFELEYSQRAARRAIETFQDAKACDHLKRIWAHPSSLVEQRMEAALELGGLLHRLGNPKEATETLESAMGVAETESPQYRGRLMSVLASVYIEGGRTDEGKQLFEQSVQLLKEQNDQRHLGIALTEQAIMLRHTGENIDTEPLFHDALAMHRRVGNRQMEARTLMALGGARHAAEDSASAEKHYDDARQISEQLGDRPAEAQCWGNLANVYVTTGRGEQAHSAYMRALQVMRELGHRATEAILLGNIGQHLLKLGNLYAGLAAGRESVRILEELNHQMLLPPFRSMLASSLTLLGKFDEAEAQLKQAEAELGDTPTLGALDHVLPALFRFYIAKATGGYGIGRDPRHPQPEYLNQAKLVLKRLRKQDTTKQSGRTQVLQGAIKERVQSLAGVTQCLSEGRATGILNNSPQLEHAPGRKKALGCWLKAVAPDQLNYMQENDPVLYARIVTETENIPEPDWRSEELPS